MADRKTRAKRRASERTSTASTSKTTQTKTSTHTDNSVKVDLPQVDLTKTNESDDVQVSLNGGVNYDKSGFGSVTVPGVTSVSFDTVSQSVQYPDFTPIGDITKPQIADDQKCDERTKDLAIAEYEQAINYQIVAQKYNDFTAQKYKTLVSAYKAYGEGLKSLSELEKVKQQFVEVLKQQKVTQEKIVGYVDAAHRTATAEAKLPYTIAEREATLNETKSKAKKAFYKAKDAEDEATMFIQGLGQNSDTSSTK